MAESVGKILQSVCDEMCDKYCKYPGTWNSEKDGDLSESEVCQNCPLMRLF